MSKKRQRRDTFEDSALKDYNANATKRPKYDLRYAPARDYCSLPQYDKQPCQHKYHLRPFDHRKPLNYFGSKQSIPKLPDSAVTKGSGVCTKNRSIAESVSIRRNAHSYSINGHIARCSNSSTASGRQRTLQALKKGTAATATSEKKSGNQQEVS